ncbi:MAG: phospho-sugar mutase [Clostridium sp.]|nr:phospho-sugar mutase [Clostridium sp.]
MSTVYETIKNEYEVWKKKVTEDADLTAELTDMEGKEDRITDAFYQNLAFGTGGLRGVIGAGTNRMNIYTVGKASQGLADYINRHFPKEERKIAISYDSRIKSSLFAKRAAEVFAANGIRVFIYTELMPTPMLSWAVRSLSCAAGVMVTASHNPSKYNGYKVYGPDGCQITTDAAAEILGCIEKTDAFEDVKREDFETALENGRISYIGEDTVTSFIEAVKGQSMLTRSEENVDKNISIVYSPLNGTGLKPVLRTLKESGFTNITVVKEQEQPDGHFPTCPYPNPEIREAMALGMEYAKKCSADLLLATDPDCDRVGIAVPNREGEYVLLSGNETGLLLLNYICSMRQAAGTMPEHPVFVKTIVTMDMAARIAADYGVKTVDVLTGFKFIGDQIARLEAEGRENDYILGFEESYGYLSGSYVRDKDAVDGAFLICEMAAYYRSKGMGLLEVLEGLYEKYGFCLNTLHSYEFEGMEGFEKMKGIMNRLHTMASRIAEGEAVCIGGRKTEAVEDYLSGTISRADKTTEPIAGLPSSDVLKFRLAGNASVVVRPSGTEPKLKLYISVSAEDKAKAQAEEEKITAQMEEWFL